jgi:hypothetical protein
MSDVVKFKYIALNNNIIYEQFRKNPHKKTRFTNKKRWNKKYLSTKNFQMQIFYFHIFLSFFLISFRKAQKRKRGKLKNEIPNKFSIYFKDRNFKSKSNQKFHSHKFVWCGGVHKLCGSEVGDGLTMYFKISKEFCNSSAVIFCLDFLCIGLEKAKINPIHNTWSQYNLFLSESFLSFYFRKFYKILTKKSLMEFVCFKFILPIAFWIPRMRNWFFSIHSFWFYYEVIWLIAWKLSWIFMNFLLMFSQKIIIAIAIYWCF